jgi:hypothetical protein
MKPWLHPVLGAAALAVAVPSQNPTPAAVAMRAYGVTIERDLVVAAGPDYEASFRHHEVEFLPMLGKASPQDLPVTWRFVSASRGETPVVGAGDVEPEASSRRVVYRRPGVVERYDVREDGIEQSFVFAKRPAGSGDLVVRLAVQAAVAGRSTADGGCEFVLDGVGGVRFGAVTGIDADGNRCRGGVVLRGSVLELSLPAAFVDAASYPMVLDPLVGAALLGPNASNDDNLPDAAYDATTDTWLVVWTRGSSTANQGIRATRVSGAGALLGSLILVSGSGSVGVKVAPRVANVAQRDRFLVVWQDAPTIFTQIDIVGRSVDAASGSMSGIVPIAATPNDEFDACISGDSTGSDDEAIVVWRESDVGIKACTVTLPAAGDPAAAGAIFVVNSLNVSDPCISRSGGSVGRHVIAWRESNAVVPSEIFARAFTRNLAALGSGPTQLTFSGANDRRPAVDGDGDSFLVVWVTGDPGDIRGRRILASSSGLTPATNDIAVEADAGQDENRPDIAYLGRNRWCVVWSEAGTNFGSTVAGTIVDEGVFRIGLELSFSGLNRTTNHVRETTPRVCGEFAGDWSAGSDQGMVVFGEGEVLPPFESDIIAQRIEALGPGGSVTTTGPSCGLGGTAGTAGPFALGNDDFQFTLTGADPSAVLCFFALGFPSASSSCGACQFMQPVITELRPFAAGSASRPFPAPAAPAFLGIGLEAQWVTLLGASSPCPTVPGLAASSRIVVTLGP